MSGEPHKLAAVETIDRPVPCVVEALKKLLELAEKGEIIGYAIATVHSDGSWGTGYSDTYSVKLVGALQFVQYRILQSIERGL